MKTVEQVICEYITQRGGDGLVHPDRACVCGLNDLAECDNPLLCVPSRYDADQGKWFAVEDVSTKGTVK